MNEILKAIKERRSIRKFKPDMPDQKVIDAIIEAGLYSASGKSRQPTIIIEVKDRELRDKLSAMNCKIGGWDEGFDPFYGAPVILIVLANSESPTHVYDGSLTLGNMMLAAHALGLGSCWIHRAKQEFESPEGHAILESLGLTGSYEGIGHLALGYVDGEVPAPAERKPGRVFVI